MIRINLLPKKVQESKGVQRVFTYWVIGASVAGLVMVVLLLNLLGQTRRYQITRVSLEKKLSDMTAQTEPLRQLMQQEQAIRQSKGLVQQLSARQGIWIRILNDLVLRVQDDLWLSRLSSKPEGDKGFLAIEVEGEAYNKIAVADFMTAMEASPLFDRVGLEALNDVKNETQTWVQFKLRVRCIGLDAGGS